MIFFFFGGFGFGFLLCLFCGVGGDVLIFFSATDGSEQVVLALVI